MIGEYSYHIECEYLLCVNTSQINSQSYQLYTVRLYFMYSALRLGYSLF